MLLTSISVSPICCLPQSVLAQYAAYLAKDLKPASVRQYMNIVRILHLEANLKNSLQDNWSLKSTLTGIDRVLGDPVKRTPVTSQILMDIRHHLNMAHLYDIMFWPAAMLMFYGLLRKSNWFPNELHQFDQKKQFQRSDFTWNKDGSITVNVKYSKTNQFQRQPFDLSQCYYLICM